MKKLEIKAKDIYSCLNHLTHANPARSLLFFLYFCSIFCCFLFVCCIFILLSRESDCGAIFRTNPHPLWSYPFPRFQVDSMTSYHLICCLFEAIKQK